MIPQHKNLTYDEFLEIDKNSNEILEFINGVIYNMASPSTNHQTIVSNLSTEIGIYLKGKKCKHFVAPYDIVLKDENITNRIQPDISIICNKEGFTKNNYIGAPTLVVEVLSPSTTSKDYIQKMSLYMKHGVKEYWIVSPINKEIQLFNFEEGQLKNNPYTFRINETLKSNIFKDLNIELKEIFQYEDI